MEALNTLLNKLNIKDKINQSLITKLYTDLSASDMDRNSKEIVVSILYTHIIYGIPITYLSILLKVNKNAIFDYKKALGIPTTKSTLKRFVDYLAERENIKIEYDSEDNYPAIIAKFSAIKKAKGEAYKKNTYGYSLVTLTTYREKQAYNKKV